MDDSWSSFLSTQNTEFIPTEWDSLPPLGFQRCPDCQHFHTNEVSWLQTIVIRQMSSKTSTQMWLQWCDLFQPCWDKVANFGGYIYISKLWISWLSIITSHYIAYKTIIFVVTPIILIILRVMEWLRHVDLSEYAPNLRGSGVHGALLVFEARWSW